MLQGAATEWDGLKQNIDKHVKIKKRSFSTLYFETDGLCCGILQTFQHYKDQFEIPFSVVWKNVNCTEIVRKIKKCVDGCLPMIND